MLDATLASWLYLASIEGLGNQSLRRLLQTFGSPEAVLEASHSSLCKVIRPELASAILAAPRNISLQPHEAWLSQPGRNIITIADSDYPQLLLTIPDPPLLLYVMGNFALLNRTAIAIVGSRNASAQGLRNAESFAATLGNAGLCIVSGLAQGIDAAAHKGALNTVGSSIAVIGTGIDKVYPAAHRELAHALANAGCIVSEFPLGTPPLASNFPRRNRIISGLSQGCLVVEASLQSGSLITARLALEQGREVFAIPGSIHSPLAKGCHALIKQGAKLVECAADILDELDLSATRVSAPATRSAPHPLLDHLGFDPIDMDSLLARSGLTVEALSAMLLQLELEGLVASLPGGLYQRLN